VVGDMGEGVSSEKAGEIEELDISELVQEILG
jgi:hypothetical protein